MRLFFALWPTKEAAERLFEIARAAAEQFGGKPTRQDTIHLTLAFLGEVPDEQLPLLIQSVTGVRTASFELEIDRLAHWHHNHLLWAGTTLPCAALMDLATQLQTALAEAGFATDGAKRSFSPHLSLVRKVPDTSASFQLPTIEPLRWHCSSFALVRSRLSATGPHYEDIAEFQLVRS